VPSSTPGSISTFLPSPRRGPSMGAAASCSGGIWLTTQRVQASRGHPVDGHLDVAAQIAARPDTCSPAVTDLMTHDT
jgi:hypothetical protein